MRVGGLAGTYCRGPHLALRHPTRPEVLHAWRAWFSDEETSRYLWVHFWPYSREYLEGYYRSLHSQRDKLVLSIIHRPTRRFIGIGKLDRINWRHRFAEVTVVIGEAAFRRGPYPLEAYDLLLRAAFDRLGLEAVLGCYASGQTAVRRLHERLGFAVRGRVPGLLRIGGRPQDLVVASVVRASWLRARGGG